MSLTDYRSLYDKDFIGAWDIKDADMVITITKVIGGQLVGQGGKKSKKPVIYFRGSEKGFAVNATNGKAIATMYGTHIENWVGKKIALYKSMTRNPNGDGEVECVRVRPQIPADKGSTVPAGNPSSSPQPAGTGFISGEQADQLAAAFANMDDGAHVAFLKVAKIDSLGKLKADDFEDCLGWIERRKAKKATATT